MKKSISRKSLPYRFMDRWTHRPESKTDCGYLLSFICTFVFAFGVIFLIMSLAIMPLIIGPIIAYQHLYNGLIVDLGPSNIINVWCLIFIFECVLFLSIGGYEWIKHLASVEPTKEIVRRFFEPLIWLANSDRIVTIQTWAKTQHDKFCSEIEFKD